MHCYNYGLGQGPKRFRTRKTVAKFQLILKLISDVLEYTKNEGLTGVLVSLDFRKAFDSLEWPFIKSVLNLFNFGESVK